MPYGCLMKRIQAVASENEGNTVNYLKFFKKVLNRVIPFLLLLTVLIFSIASVSAQPSESPGVPAVEWLEFQVQPQQQARFIEQDTAIWTPILASYPGFQRKKSGRTPLAPMC
jgi:hypothetical protein